MGLFDWMRGGRPATDTARQRQWRAAWTAAADALDAARAGTLRAELDQLGLPEDEVEIEREMLEGLQRALELRDAIAGGALPLLDTGHRVVGREPCHFSAPVSMPDEDAQPSGRLILTRDRAIFIGGGSRTVAWHAVGQARQVERDILLLRSARQEVRHDDLQRFRCNSFGDALCGVVLARTLIAARKGPVL